MDKKYAALDVLKQRSHGDRRHLQNNLTTLVEHTLSTDFLSLNNMIQALVLRTSEWDTSLDGFIRTFMGNIGSEDMAAYLRRLTHMPGFRKIFPPESFGMAGSVKGPDGTRSKSSISKPSFTTLRPLDVLRVGVGSRAGEDDTESPESHGLAINPSGLPDGPVAANETIDEMLETGAMGLGHGPGNKHHDRFLSPARAPRTRRAYRSPSLSDDGPPATGPEPAFAQQPPRACLYGPGRCGCRR
ncbi:hypothetical protein CAUPRSCDRAFT_12779 [Caulochytrium protostelioides]|uniref:Uncharacterized protein n=1 Tax=Caulochytrium protostelioides TaxID=1555241 RepID=A0A4P9WTI5_9FUNG|nr:hypothetical protein CAUPRSCDRAFT_12779 [Caulochytrium protostelioides]